MKFEPPPLKKFLWHLWSNLLSFINFLGKEAERLFNDAQGMLKNIINKNLLEARAIVAFYPANSVGDDIYVYESEGWRMIHP